MCQENEEQIVGTRSEVSSCAVTRQQRVKFGEEVNSTVTNCSELELRGLIVKGNFPTQERMTSQPSKIANFLFFHVVPTRLA